MGSELKPCPFCGGRASKDPAAEWVQCEECGATGAAWQGQKEAIEAWNRRALSAQQPEAVATCSCGAPCRKEVLERGGDNGWGDDASRTVLRYVPPTQPQGAVSDELVRRVLDGLPDCSPTENGVRIALTAALRPDATP